MMINVNALRPPTYCVLCDDDHGEVVGYLACRVCGETYCPKGVCHGCQDAAFIRYHRLSSVEPLHQLLKPLRQMQEQFKHGATRQERRTACWDIRQFHHEHVDELIALHYYDKSEQHSSGATP